MRKILLGAIVLAAASAVVLVGPARASYNGTNCTGYGTDAGLVSVATPGTGETGATLAGVCVDEALPITGVVEVGGGLHNGNRLCGTGLGTVLVPTPAGAYVVADGHDTNSGALGGYAALSTYENGGRETGACEGNNGSGTNSGGSVGITEIAGNPVGLYLPIPAASCGNDDSGKNFNSSSRDGCYVDSDLLP